MKKTVAVLDPIHDLAIRELKKYFTVIEPKDLNKVSWHDLADAVVVRNSKITYEDINKSKRLRMIGKHGAGIDNIDHVYAKQKNILIKNTPGVNAQSVAELALAFCLNILRQIDFHNKSIKEGISISQNQRIGQELFASKIGIIGYGAVGSTLGNILYHGFNCQILAYDPFKAKENFPQYVTPVSQIEECVNCVEILFIHVDLNKDSFHLISKDILKNMKKNIIIINCSRGGVVDESALDEFLKNNPEAHAASDVFEHEPVNKSLSILKNNNFMATPHIGASTENALLRTGLTIVDKIKKHLL